MRIPVAIYPYCAELLPIVKYFETLQKEYTISKLISPPGLGLGGKDSAYACNHPDMGLIVTDIIDVADPSWDVLMLTRPEKPIVSDAMLSEVAEAAIAAEKRVLYFDESMVKIPEQILAMSRLHPEKIRLLTEKTSPLAGKEASKYTLLKTPVILVGGLVEEADVLEVLMGIRACMRETNLHPLVVSKQTLGRIFGFHSISHIFNESETAIDQKILKLNLFLQDLEHDELPDVILLEAPDALMRFNNFAPNGFGILTYMLCQAVAPDYLVCCTPCDLGVGDLLEMLSKDFEYRLGAPIVAAHISNAVVDSAQILQTNQVSVVHEDLKEVQAQLEREACKSRIPLFDVVSHGPRGLYESLFENIL